MLVMNDFKCRNGHRHEALLPKGQKQTFCTVCGEVASVCLTAPRIKLEGWSGSFPSAAMKWDRDHKNASQKKP